MSVKYLEKKIAKWTFDVSEQVESVAYDAADISEADDTITVLSHPFVTGDMVTVKLKVTSGVAGSAVPTVGTAYYVIYVDKDTIALATNLANAKAGTKQALTAGTAADNILVKNAYGAIASGLVIPSGATVTSVYYDVETAFSSADGAGPADGNVDAATIALSLASANDLVSAVDLTTPFAAGRFGTLIGSPVLGTCASGADTALEYAIANATAWLHLTSDCELTLTVANGDPLWAGKINVFVEYVI